MEASARGERGGPAGSTGGRVGVTTMLDDVFRLRIIRRERARRGAGAVNGMVGKGVGEKTNVVCGVRSGRVVAIAIPK